MCGIDPLRTWGNESFADSRTVLRTAIFLLKRALCALMFQRLKLTHCTTFERRNRGSREAEMQFSIRRVPEGDYQCVSLRQF